MTQQQQQQQQQKYGSIRVKGATLLAGIINYNQTNKQIVNNDDDLLSSNEFIFLY